MDDLLSTATVVAILESGHTVRALNISAGTGPALWQQLRAAHGQTELWPFLLDKTSDRELVWSEANERNVWGGGQRTAQQIFESEPWNYDEAVNLPDHPRPGRLAAADTDGIGLIRTSAGGCDIPQLLRWNGAANNGLSGSDVTTVLTYWHARFGAELIVLAHDSLSLFVPRPPSTATEVVEVGMQHDAFCPDISEPFDYLLQEQVHSHYWYFWWD